jgi:hypothetical protein
MSTATARPLRKFVVTVLNGDQSVTVRQAPTKSLMARQLCKENGGFKCEKYGQFSHTVACRNGKVFDLWYQM